MKQQSMPPIKVMPVKAKKQKRKRQGNYFLKKESKIKNCFEHLEFIGLITTTTTNKQERPPASENE